MIRPPGFRGVAFTTARDGDLREDRDARTRVSDRLGIAGTWATVRQVHGGRVVQAEGPGRAGPADAIFTRRPGLPVAVFTADCPAVAMETEATVGIAHAGWRGIVSGVVERLRDEMVASGDSTLRVAIGPGIGSCCFEVGPEVAAHFPGSTATTSWGTTGVDLVGDILARLDGLDVWRADLCSRCDSGFFSHRRDGTLNRMAGIAWIP